MPKRNSSRTKRTSSQPGLLKRLGHRALRLLLSFVAILGGLVTSLLIQAIFSGIVRADVPTFRFQLEENRQRELQARLDACGQDAQCFVRMIEGSSAQPGAATLARRYYEDSLKEMHPIVRRAVARACRGQMGWIRVTQCGRDALHTMQEDVRQIQLARRLRDESAQTLFRGLARRNHFTAAILAETCEGEVPSSGCFDGNLAVLRDQLLSAHDQMADAFVEVITVSAAVNFCNQRAGFGRCTVRQAWTDGLNLTPEHVDSIEYLPNRLLPGPQAQSPNWDAPQAVEPPPATVPQPRSRAERRRSQRGRGQGRRTGDGQGTSPTPPATPPEVPAIPPVTPPPGVEVVIVPTPVPPQVVPVPAPEQPNPPTPEQPPSLPEPRPEPVPPTVPPGTPAQPGLPPVPEVEPQPVPQPQVPPPQPPTTVPPSEPPPTPAEPPRRPARPDPHQAVRGIALGILGDLEAELGTGDGCSPERMAQYDEVIRQAESGRAWIVGRLDPIANGAVVTAEASRYACDVAARHAQNPNARLLAQAALRIAVIFTDPEQHVAEVLEWVAWVEDAMSQLEQDPGVAGASDLAALRQYIAQTRQTLISAEDSAVSTAFGILATRNSPISQPNRLFCAWRRAVDLADPGAATRFPRSLISCR